MTRRVRPLLVVLAAIVVFAGVVASTTSHLNPSTLPSGLSLTANADSTALYCTGLGDHQSGLEGRVVLANTTSASHVVLISVVSNTGRTWNTEHDIAANTTWSFDPSTTEPGQDYGVAVLVSGGGVVGQEVTAAKNSGVPCVSSGTNQWYGAGFNTLVGSYSAVSIYNPTATAAVLNVSTFSSLGFAAPARFQGIAVGPHQQTEVDLGAQLVNTTNIAVRVHVLRGSLAIVGVQQSGAVASFSQGLAAASTTATYPSVTTVARATSEIRVANPGPFTAHVTFAVRLGSFKIPEQYLTIPAYTSAIQTINPNTAIPAAGLASITMTSNVPVVSSLATGSNGDVALSSPVTPASQFLVGDFTGNGFASATLANTSHSQLSVTVTDTKSGASSSASIPGDASVDLATIVHESLRARFILVTATSSALVATMTLPSSPSGIAVVPGLDGR